MLGAELATRALPTSAVVLGLVRGGVPVAFEVAAALHAPLDVAVVRKLGVPWQPELAMGAVAARGVTMLDEAMVRDLGISRSEIDEAIARETAEVSRREEMYREGRAAPEIAGRTTILVDDGLATGASMAVAVRYVQLFRPAAVIVAVPVGAADSCRRLRQLASECVCLAAPEPFGAVGAWYENFQQVSDAEVQALLERSHQSADARTLHVT